MVEQSAEFKTAVENIRKLKAKPNNDELLSLYAHFKVATQDPPFAEAKKPGMFDLAGKAKYNKWKELEDAGTTPEQAQAEYVKIAKSLEEKYGMSE